MKKKYLLIVLMLCAFKSVAQSTILNLTLFQDEIRLKDTLKVNILIDNKCVNLVVKDSLLFMPDSIYGKTVILEISTQKYKLNFYNLTIRWNKEYLNWYIYVDFLPFDRQWVVNGKLKKMKWVYAIDRGNGTMITYYGRKRFNKHIKK